MPTPLWAGPSKTWGEKLDPKSPTYLKTQEDGLNIQGRSARFDPSSLAPLAALRRGDNVVLPLVDGDRVIGKVNVVQQEAAGRVRVGGALTGPRTGSFSLGSGGKKIGGTILLPREEIAYTIIEQHDGQVLMQETPLSEVICFPIPRPKGEPVAVARSLGPHESPPLLSSRPGTTAVLYLDFDGETVIDPDWNEGNPIVAQASSLSQLEITEVWNRVKEDFWPFNIDVTTDVSRYNNAPVGSRMRCIITPTDTASPGVGGVAYLKSFDDPADSFSSTIPCWVFNSSVVGIAEAISHELGHTLGLKHDGRTSPVEPYYQGHGNGAVGWAPIMGIGYYKPLVQWSKGEYLNANNQEDDMAIIANSANGFGFVADDAGASRAAAVPLHAPAGAVNQIGVIASASDIDYYVFTVAAAGTVSIHANPASFSPNLDILLEAQDSAGMVLANSNPDTALNAGLSFNVVAGTYYIKVQGQGRGPVLGDGYSNYGSIGHYSLTGTLDGSSETSFVTGAVLGSLRNDFSGWVGMKITVGANPVTVTELGRIFVNGNSGTHVVKLVRASDQVDVPNGAASITMAGGSAGQFKYGRLSSPVILTAGTVYYLVSQEINGGDQWHDLNSVTTTSAANCDTGAYFGSGYPWSVWGPNRSYVPLDFKYTTASPGIPTVTIAASDATAGEPGNDTAQWTISRSGSTATPLTVNYTVGGTATSGTDYASLGSSATIAAGSPSTTITLTPMDDPVAEGLETVVVTLSAHAAYALGSAHTATVTIADDEPSSETSFVTGAVLGSLRNDFSGWVGMKITVGANPVTVTELGRIFVNGNSGIHVVKLVRASDQVDVPNGAASITMAGGSAGQFKYGRLSSPVMLTAGTAYYLVSEEVNGGDQWHDLNNVTTTSAATCDIGAYFGSGYPWGLWGPNRSYVPLDFKYTTAGPSMPTVIITASDATAGEPGNDTAQWTISRSGSTATPLTVNYTVGGTATAGTDYVSLGSSATIAAGSPSTTITLTPMDDPVAEGLETVVVTLSAHAAYALGSAHTATVTIADDEPSSETSFVTGAVLGSLRNDFSGWVGMKITVGANPVTVTELGRIFVNGNSGTHVVKLVRASDQVDVPNGAASITMAGGSAGQFKYGRLSSPVILAAGAVYYLVSEEVNGGDQWHDLNNVTTTSAATCDIGAYFGSGYPWGLWGPNRSYVPLDFKYTTAGPSMPTVTITASDATAGEPGNDTAQWTISRSGSTTTPLTVNYTVGGTATSGTDYASLGSSATIAAGSPSTTITLTPMDDPVAEGLETVVVTLSAHAAYALGSAHTATVTIADDEPSSETSFVTGAVLGSLRNDFSGWVGMKITVGANPVTVTELGRIFVNGNSGIHVVKLVRASDQVDVPNGAASITMTGGSAGQFKYGRLSSPVILTAGAVYYLVSEEVNGGDQWHDLNNVTTTSVAACDRGAYFGSDYPWSVNGWPGQSYVPLDFKYVVVSSPSSGDANGL